MTFDALVQAIAEAFTPERRVRRSALHRWWQTHGKPDAQVNRQTSTEKT